MTILNHARIRQSAAALFGVSGLRVAVVAAIHAVAVVLIFRTEYGAYHITLAALAWALLNFLWLGLLKRPAISAALSLATVLFLLVMSEFKYRIVMMTATFLDLLIIDSDTAGFLGRIFPQLRPLVLIGLGVGLPLGYVLWRLDRFRVRRRMAAAGAGACLAVIVPMSLLVPEQAWEPFQGVNHVSNFARSGIFASWELTRAGWFDADPVAAGRAVAAPATMTLEETCRPMGRLPNIVVVLDESSFDASAAPGIKLPSGYPGYFQSFDGKARSLLVEATGGPTWYSEYNVLTGLSARSYGKLMYYVTRIAAERVARGLPRALQRCGYRTFSLYPDYGDFLSTRRFQTGVGIEHFIDRSGMNADVDVAPDRFFFDQARQVIAQERGAAPLFLFVYVMANHFPWTYDFKPELTPGWKPLGNTPEVDEYLRRQSMSAEDYKSFLAGLKADFPDEPFLVVRFGDHQPAISTRMLEPALKPKDIARHVMQRDPKYFTTYYAIDAVNFAPVDLSSARATLDAPYLPLVIQEVAGVPLEPSFVEQKRILERCSGLFFACADGAEARRFNRLLIDAGLIKGL